MNDKGMVFTVQKAPPLMSRGTLLFPTADEGSFIAGDGLFVDGGVMAV